MKLSTTCRCLGLLGLAPGIAACLIGYGDPSFYLWIKNDSSATVLVREAFEGNVRDGITDPVYEITPHSLAWVEPGHIGHGPDRLEFLTDECRVYFSMASRDNAGGITVSTDAQIVFVESAELPPGRVVQARTPNRCPNR